MSLSGISKEKTNTVLISRKKLPILFLISSVLLILSWHSDKTSFMVFVAFVPIFILFFEGKPLRKHLRELTILCILVIFFWVYFTIYWIHPIDYVSHISISLVESLLLSIPIIAGMIFSTRTKTKPVLSFLVTLSLWILIEILHDKNILGFPYLNLGHVLGAYPRIIQWYSLTGSISGTAWIFTVNFELALLIAILAKKNVSKHRKMYILIISLLTLVIPVSFSIISSKKDNPDLRSDCKAIIVHTNADVYNYKYEISPDSLLNEYISLTKPAICDNSSYTIFWPENAITHDILINQTDSSWAITRIKEQLLIDSNNYLISGAILDSIVREPEKNAYEPNVGFNDENAYYYRHYNSALLIQPGTRTRVKTKKRLVPFSEKKPESKILSPLLHFFPNMADLSFSSREESYNVFSSNNDSIRTSPIICYGIAFSSYCADEILNSKSNYIAVISNEGWMQSKKAYNHFTWFSTCRSIENRRFLIKSSNMGVSCVLDMQGRLLDSISGNSPGVIHTSIKANNSYSFFTKNNAAIAIIEIALVIIVLCCAIVPLKKNKEETR